MSNFLQGPPSSSYALGFRATPLRLAALTALGSVVSVIAFASVRRYRDSLPALLVCAVFALAGVVLVYYAPYRLRDGVTHERWAAKELEPLRRVVEHPTWTVMTLTLVIAMIASLVVADRYNLYFWGAFVLLQPLSQLTNALRRQPRTAEAPARLDWTKVPPLQSDHWGEP